MLVLLIGDSDMSRWPRSLLPAVEIQSGKGHPGHPLQVIDHYAKSGALMKDLPKQGKRAMKEILSQTENVDSIFFIACAGENDLSSGIPVEAVIRSFEATIDIIFSGPCLCPMHLIFLGPKIEPWMEDDLDARKAYFNLSEHLSRKCQAISGSMSNGCSIMYVDCLKMFCGDTAHLPVASNAEKAAAQVEYFDEDGLHLSDSGYSIWKGIVESAVEKILSCI